MTAMTTRGAIDLELPDYETASLVGQHNAAVKAFMDTNDVSDLRPFEGRTVKDASGRTLRPRNTPKRHSPPRCERRNPSSRSIASFNRSREMDDKQQKA